MTTPAQSRRHAFGRATEHRFALDASERGFHCWLTPSAPGYDAIVDTGAGLVRVQIKGSSKRNAGNSTTRYSATFNRSSGYNFDVLAVWLGDVGEWLFATNADVPRGHGSHPMHSVGIGKRSPLLAGVADWAIFERETRR